MGFGYAYDSDFTPTYFLGAENDFAYISPNEFEFNGIAGIPKNPSRLPSGVSGYMRALGTSKAGRVITITILGGASATSLTTYDLLQQTCTKVQ